jgi:type I restriction enzyme R subunit
LNFFHSAVQLGMTATPLRDDNRDTYAYSGNPLYLYSLKQGIKVFIKQQRAMFSPAVVG